MVVISVIRFFWCVMENCFHIEFFIGYFIESILKLNGILVEIITKKLLLPRLFLQIWKNLAGFFSVFIWGLVTALFLLLLLLLSWSFSKFGLKLIWLFHILLFLSNIRRHSPQFIFLYRKIFLLEFLLFKESFRKFILKFAKHVFTEDLWKVSSFLLLLNLALSCAQPFQNCTSLVESIHSLRPNVKSLKLGVKKSSFHFRFIKVRFF